MINTSANAGCLAYDAHSGILWGGQSGGLVIPYDITTLQPLNAGFLPFGAIEPTIDGCGFFTPAFNGEKTWTETDYNWDPVCDGVVQADTCFDNLTDLNDIGFRPANINNAGDDVLADTLPQDGAAKYVVFAQVHNNNKFSNTNPGAFYALTTVNIVDQFGELDGLKVTENYDLCTNPDGIDNTDDGMLKFVSKKITRNVKVAVADPNGDITELTDDLYDGIGGTITADINSAIVDLTDTSNLTAGSTVYVLVKFNDNLKGFNAPGGIFDDVCMNSEDVEGIFNGAENELLTLDAALRITNVP